MDMEALKTGIVVEDNKESTTGRLAASEIKQLNHARFHAEGACAGDAPCIVEVPPTNEEIGRLTLSLELQEHTVNSRIEGKLGTVGKLQPYLRQDAFERELHDVCEREGARWYPQGAKRVAVVQALMVELERTAAKETGVSTGYARGVVWHFGSSFDTNISLIITQLEHTGWLTKEGQEVLAKYTVYSYVRQFRNRVMRVHSFLTKKTLQVAAVSLKVRHLRESIASLFRD